MFKVNSKNIILLIKATAGREVKEVEGQRHTYLLVKFVKSEQVNHNLSIPEAKFLSTRFRDLSSGISCSNFKS